MKRFLSLFLALAMILSIALSSVSCDELLAELLEEPVEDVTDDVNKETTKKTTEKETEEITEEDKEPDTNEDKTNPTETFAPDSTEYPKEHPTEAPTRPIEDSTVPPMEYPTEEHKCLDKSPRDHYCDVCGVQINDCRDKDLDHYCDICKNLMSKCEIDNNKDHICDECGKLFSECYDYDNDAYCDYCGMRIGSDPNEHYCYDEKPQDHYCDECGKILTYCPEDYDQNHICDVCCLKYSECYDGNDDGYCDACGKLLRAPDPTYENTLSISEAIDLGLSMDHNGYTEDKYFVTGTVKEIRNAIYGNLYIADEYGNEFYVYGAYSADGSVRFDKLEVQPKIGDIVTVYGTIGQYNGTPQMKKGWITEIIETAAPDPMPEPEPEPYGQYTILEALELEDGTNVVVTGTVVKINTAWSDVYCNMSVTIADAEGNELYVYRLSTIVSEGDVIIVTGTMGSYNGQKQIAKGATAEIIGSVDTPDPMPEPEPEPELGNGTVYVTMEQIAMENEWASSTSYTEFYMDGGFYVSLEVREYSIYGANSGKYYTSDYSWRMYQHEYPILTITAPEGKTIKTVKISYISQKGGVLTHDSVHIETDELIYVDDYLITFEVSNSGDELKGQARITAIEISYI